MTKLIFCCHFMAEIQTAHAYFSGHTMASLSLYLHLKKISRKEWAPDWYRDFFMSLPLLYLPFLINTPHIPQQLTNSACCWTNTTIICYWKDSMKSVCRQISNRTTNNSGQQTCPWHQWLNKMIFLVCLLLETWESHCACLCGFLKSVPYLNCCVDI